MPKGGTLVSAYRYVAYRYGDWRGRRDLANRVLLDRRRPREAAFESFAGQPELNASSDTTLKYLLIP